MRMRILANLGFLLQGCGLMLMIPILVGVYNNEREGIIAVSLGCVSFLIVGFLLNALCERRELDYKSSCLLILLSFLVMSIVGSIPYLYLDPFQSTGLVERLTNSLFESVSGFTTTGLTLLSDGTVLPQSFDLFRSMTEFIGGVGVVFILLVFFQSEHALNSLGLALGIESVNLNLKKSFMMVLLVYGVYVLIFTVPVFFLGFQDVVKAVTLVIDTMTGGFSPSKATFEASIGLPLRIVLLFLMLLGSLNFKFNYYFLSGKLRKALNEEAKLYLVIIVAGSLLIAVLSGLNLFDSVFHVISMSSATGFDYIGLVTIYDPAKTVFIVLMLIGGCAASMAGGIKVINVLWSSLYVRDTVSGVINGSGVVSPRSVNPERLQQWNMATSSLLLFLIILLVFSLIFSTSGVSFWDSLFEVGSALTTNGISTGATRIALPVFYKFVLMTAMIIGRVEITIIVVSLIIGKPIISDALKHAYVQLKGYAKKSKISANLHRK